MRTRQPILRSIIISCLTAVMLACATVGPGEPADPPSFRFRGFNDADSSLYLALRAAEHVDDLFARVSIYSRIAEGYSLAGHWPESLTVLEHLEQVSRVVGSAEARAEIDIETARRYIANDEIEIAIGLLDSALRAAGEIELHWNRGVIIEGIIQACFEGGEDTFGVLQRAINQTLVIDDLWTRVSILTNTARRYQRAGLGQSVNAMVQQAIPAAGSLENPWQRALAFTEIALISRNAGDRRAEDTNTRRAVAELEAIEVLAIAEDDARLLVRVVANLADLGRHNQAVAALQQVPFHHLHAEGLAEVGSAYARQGSRSSAFVLFSQAVREGEQSNDPYRRAEVYADIAHRYLAMGDVQLAALNADFARTAAETLTDEYQKAAIFERISPVYIEEGAIELPAELGGQMSDRYLRAEVLAAVAQQLRAAGRTAEAREALERALSAAGEAEYLQDTLFRRIASVFAELDELTRALEVVQRVQSAYEISRALADIGAISAGSPSGRLPRDNDELRVISARIAAL